MKPVHLLVLASLLPMASPIFAADDKLPPAGSYGFDSMKPASTHCVKLDPALLARLKECTYSDSNSFGDSRPGYACKLDKHSGFMAYKTLADCKSELELERSNGD